jgi:hypothetical protein
MFLSGSGPFDVSRSWGNRDSRTGENGYMCVTQAYKTGRSSLLNPEHKAKVLNTKQNV